MLNPSMQELMKRVGNRYLLVNLAAQRARDIADEAEEKGEPLPGPRLLSWRSMRLQPARSFTVRVRVWRLPIPQNNAIAAAMVDVDDTLDLDEDEEHTDSEADEDKDENADEVRRLNEFDDGSLSDGDIPEEDL